MAISARDPRFGVALVAGAFFMENLDGTIIATAMPQMGRAFGVSPVDLHIGMTVYMLTLAVFIPISGWVADRFGTRTVFAAAIAVFTAASLFCGLCSTLPMFVLARVIQGVGGAMMVPVGRLVVLRATEKKDLVRAIATLVWPGLVAPVVAPPIGGFLTTYADWRWIFFINIPLGVAALILTLRWVRNEKAQNPPPLDVWTFLLSGAACTAFLIALEELRRQVLHWRLVGLLLAITLVGSVLAVLTTRRARAPLIDLESLRLRTFAFALGGGSIFRSAVSVTPFLLPLLFQVGFGMSAFHAGLLTFVLFVGNLGMKPLTTGVLKRFGFRASLLANGLFTLLSVAACALFTPRLPLALIVVILLWNGVCRSMQLTAITTITFVDVPQERMGAANSFSTLVQRLTMGMGVAIGALGLRFGAFLRGGTGAATTLGDFQVAFLMAGALMVVGLVDAFTLAPDAGSITSGHQPRK
nr:MFS transporter [uncultured Holophaga sp.]